MEQKAMPVLTRSWGVTVLTLLLVGGRGTIPDTSGFSIVAPSSPGTQEAPSEWAFQWECTQSEALVYGVTQGKKARPKFVVFGTELDGDGGNSIAVKSCKEIPYALAFVLPKDRVKVGSSWKLKKVFFERGFVTNSGRFSVQVTGEYTLRRVVKEKDVECGVIEGVFSVFQVKNEKALAKHSGRISVNSYVNLATSRIEKAEVFMEAQLHEIGLEDADPALKKSSFQESLQFESKVKLALDENMIKGINGTIDKGLVGLKKLQKADGSFVESAGVLGSQTFRIGSTALATMALVHAGTKPDDPSIVKAYAFMRNEFRNKKRRTYDIALFCMAVETKYLPLRDFADLAKLTEDDAREHVKKNITKEDMAILKEAAAWLVENQTAMGTWGYPEQSNAYDNSNTQYALLALKSCSRCGITIKPEVWTRAATHWSRTSGGWGYTILADGDPWNSSLSMTCAGLTSLIICKSELQAAKALDGTLSDKIGKAQRASFEALERYFTARTNEPAASWNVKFWLYYLFSLERVGIMYGIRKVGNHDWYLEGTVLLMNAQGNDGTWNQSIYKLPLSDTAFAILFLKRATLTVRTK